MKVVGSSADMQSSAVFLEEESLRREEKIVVVHVFSHLAKDHIKRETNKR